MVASRKKISSRSMTAKLLVLGDKQVGKSASIVRYTTGRYIQEYSGSTNDWLYKHSLGFDAKQNVTTLVELLEQKDIQFKNSSNFFAISSNNVNNCSLSLASRVALDQQIDNEFHEKQQLLNKLHWANAYIVIYAINDISTFNKAIKYLNLIANNINSPLDNQQQSNSNTSSNSNSSSSNSCGSCSGTGSNISINSLVGNVGAERKFLNRLSPASALSYNQSQSNHCLSNKSSPNHLSISCSCGQSNGNVKRPILLLANKRDLEKGGRQVSTADGRLLAMRHHSMFAEISIAESNKLIENIISNLIEQIDPACFQMHQQSQQVPKASEQQPKIVQWMPTIELALNQSNNSLSTPIWGSLVKSQPTGLTVVQSSRVVNSRIETDTRLIAPVSLAQSVEVAKSVRCLRPMVAQRIGKQVESIPNDQRSSSSKLNASIYQNKYENLKSSFKRASMAIVSSKALAKVSKESETGLCTNRDDAKRAAVDDSEQVENVEPTAKTKSRKISTVSTTSAPSNWLKNHMKLKRSSEGVSSISDPKLDVVSTSSSSQFGEKLKRPLLKYKTRRKTVAFEPNELDKSKSSATGESSFENEMQIKHNLTTLSKTSSQSKVLEKKVSEESKASSSGSYNSTRSSSGRSSSSLSTADVYYSALFVLWNSERAPSLAGSTSLSSSDQSTAKNYPTEAKRHSSKSILSRASTSGASNDSDDEVSSIRNIAMEDTDKMLNQPSGMGKKKHQIVKSVQNTLTNFTKSSNVSATAAKRSFCNALFKFPSNQSTTLATKTITPPLLNLAKTEQISTIPTVGYCK